MPASVQSPVGSGHLERPAAQRHRQARCTMGRPQHGAMPGAKHHRQRPIAGDGVPRLVLFVVGLKVKGGHGGHHDQRRPGCAELGHHLPAANTRRHHRSVADRRRHRDDRAVRDVARERMARSPRSAPTSSGSGRAPAAATAITLRTNRATAVTRAQDRVR
jgi:hypothetical protein